MKSKIQTPTANLYQVAPTKLCIVWKAIFRHPLQVVSSDVSPLKLIINCMKSRISHCSLNWRQSKSNLHRIHHEDWADSLTSQKLCASTQKVKLCDVTKKCISVVRNLLPNHPSLNKLPNCTQVAKLHKSCQITQSKSCPRVAAKLPKKNHPALRSFQSLCPNLLCLNQSVPS